MNFGLALSQMYPNITPSQYELMMRSDGSVKITRWDPTNVQQPTEDEVISYWNTNEIVYLRGQKKNELSVKCDGALAGGFTSSALGVAHTYPSHDKAQQNFNTEMQRFLSDATYTSCKFFTEDAGYLEHTKDQFFKAFADGHDFGNAQWDKLFNLYTQVDAAQSQTDLDAITW